MDYWNRIVTEIEILSAEGIRECLENGVDPNGKAGGIPLVEELISGYARGPRFSKCFRVFIDHGLHFDKALAAVLSNDPASLDALLVADKSIVSNRYSFRCAFTPLDDVSLLHICAEFNHLDSATVLVKHGADVDAQAGLDAHGFGGQTPVFHTVNQHGGDGIDVMKYLIDQSADLSLTVKGLIWGKGYEWETFIPAVNPISYAMMGLLPQFQREEAQIYETVSMLMEARYALKFDPSNVPNRYLKKG